MTTTSPTPLSAALTPFQNLAEATHQTLALLHNRLGFQLWMVTRTEGNDWIVLVSNDHGYGVEPGQVFRWCDSFCSRMVQGFGPNIAPDSRAVAAYLEAPIGQQVEIQAYIGMPLLRPDGHLFGTLCAIDPQPQPDRLHHELPFLQLQARFLSTLIEQDLQAQEMVRRLEHAQLQAHTDSMTGLYNRRGWDLLMATEEERCRRYGSPATIFVLDLDWLKQINDTLGHQAGDQVIMAAANHLRQTVRASDVVARLGGDEFAILAVEMAASDAESFAQRILDSIEAGGIQMSLGWASRDPRHSLQTTIATADERMYRIKQLRQRAASHLPTFCSYPASRSLRDPMPGSV
ncbi:sensor domain-containing diguanylate cyclase [Halomicronema hongdechloris C2206]|uniref:Sensor domain-containing diguanylate cyclase n=1 Tax=Halomicronema hongdechloris C2206 TaxID=1641165 RepID=A0A1Z3HU15_9CYAN|nr:sensor domain-containing diguanylate cyclase [Halomicronema hongdechloris]ASC73789.1 sensor domain-containing diguanylate cyclase [Halomicronema hongdechloris C2206]